MVRWTAVPGPRRLLVLGAGGHARVIVDIVRASGTFDDMVLVAPDGPDVLDGVPRVGGDEVIDELHADGIRWAFVALGANGLRQRLAGDLLARGFALANAVHPSAYVAPSATLGHGVAIMAGAVVHPGSTIGDLTIVNTRASVDHDCTVGVACHIAPGATVCGTVRIGDRSWIGAGATVIEGRCVDSDVLVGAGATVVTDLSGGALALGTPARFVR